MCEYVLANVAPTPDPVPPLSTQAYAAGDRVCAVFVCGIVVRIFERFCDRVGVECNLPCGLVDYDNVDSVLFWHCADVISHRIIVLHQSDVDVITIGKTENISHRILLGG